MQNEKLRNVAIIAHVDHGKTTLVDQMLKQGGVYRENQETVERVMDSNDLERERGITILAKNTAIQYGDTKINIVDTPGHADFGGEVERILKMVNGVILLVDAAEGPMPQTRFVLSRALELGHRVIVVVNKIDRPDQRIHEVIDEVLELLLDLDATPEQLDSPMLFCSARQGVASYSPDVPGTDLKPLFDTILSYIPAPEADLDQPFQMLVSSIDYNEFVGRIAIGRIERGVLKQNQEIAVCNYHDPDAPAKKAKAVSMYEFEGLGKKPITEATAGNIIALSGIPDITIGDTICATSCVEPLPFVKISAPTMEMTFSVNDSPYAGREGKFVTSRQLRERLFRETLKDVSLRVTELDGATDAFNVAGRGEMSLSILIETMRREGYEFQVSPPRVLYQTIDGKKCEPIERLVVDVPSESVGAVIEKLGARKGDLLEMTPVGSRMKLEFLIPARGLYHIRCLLCAIWFIIQRFPVEYKRKPTQKRLSAGKKCRRQHPAQHGTEGKALHALRRPDGDGLHRLAGGIRQRQSPQFLSGGHRGLHLFRQCDGLGQTPGLTFLQQRHRFLRVDAGLHRLRLPQHHRDGGEGFLRHRVQQGIGGEAVVQQGLGILEPLLAGGGLQHHGDELHALPLRRGGQAVFGAVGGAGFQTRGPVVEPDQLVGVGQLELPVPEGVHPDGGVLPHLRVAEDELPGHQGDVIGRGDVTLGRQAGAVAKDRVLHAQLLGPLVHPLHEGGLGAAEMLREGHCAVVGRDHGHRLQKIVYGDLLTLRQVDMAAAHRGGVGADRHHIVVVEAALFDGLHGQKQRHHLGDAGRLQRLVLILGVQHLSRLFLHQQCRLRLYRQLYRSGLYRRQRQHQQERRP